MGSVHVVVEKKDSIVLYTPPPIPIPKTVLSFHLIQPEDANCSVCYNIGITSTYDMAEAKFAQWTCILKT
jgi:hypothetical protein